MGCAEFGFACFFFRGKFGLTTLVVSDRYAKYKDHEDLRRDVQLFSLDPCSSWLFTRSSRRRRKSCMKDDVQELDTFITGDLNMDLGLLCTCDDDVQDFREMYGPQCLLGGEADPGSVKKLMWYVMEEFNCEVVSLWSSCGERRERAFTHREKVERSHSWTTSWGPRRIRA